MPLFVGLDASLLAVPNFASSPDEAELIVRRIAYWAKQASADREVQPAIMSDTVDVLAAGNYFPSGPNVRALLELFALHTVYSPEDVRRAINTILDRASHFIEAIGIEVTACSDFVSDPNLERFAGEQALFNSASLAMCSVLSAGPLVGVKVPFMASGFPTSDHEIRIRALVDSASQLVVPAEVPVFFQTPYSVVGSVKIIDEVSEVAVALGSRFLWRRAATARELHLAIATKIVELSRASGTNATLRDVPRFAIGSEFVASARRIGAAGERGIYSDTVLETCARVIMGKPKYPILDFRMTKSKSSPVHSRQWDQARGRRTHVTKSHAAIRLMLWECAGGSIELANLGVKSELLILEGTAGGAWGLDYGDRA